MGYLARMAFEYAQLCSACRVPKPDRGSTCRGQSLTIVTERDGLDVVVVRQSSQFSERGRVPNPCHAPFAAGPRQQPAVGTEDHTDSLDLPRLQFLLRAQVPKGRPAIVGARHQPRTVGADRYERRAIGTSLDLQQWLKSSGLPNLRGSRPVSHQQPPVATPSNSLAAVAKRLKQYTRRNVPDVDSSMRWPPTSRRGTQIHNVRGPSPGMFWGRPIMPNSTRRSLRRLVTQRRYAAPKRFGTTAPW